jgi:acetyltransferase-like isoleucine patch superfamily enzyme
LARSSFLDSCNFNRAAFYFARILKRVSWLLLKKPIQIGKFSYGSPKVEMLTDRYRLVIGRFCSIAANVRILVDSNHRPDWISTYPFGELIPGLARNPGHPAGKGDMVLGNDVWIGRDVLIVPGVQIGDGAVIAAGSVVTRNVDDYEIVGGNPARHIRYRFTDQQITELRRIKWWDWPLDKIKANHHLLQSSNVDEFIEKFRGEIPVKSSSEAIQIKPNEAYKKN